MPEAILVLSSSVFLYTLQGGEGRGGGGWAGEAMAPGQEMLDRLPEGC